MSEAWPLWGPGSAGSNTTPGNENVNQNSVPGNVAPEAAGKLLIQLLGGEFHDREAVRQAVGDVLGLGRPATDGEVRNLFAKFTDVLKDLGPGATGYVSKLIQAYDQLPETASAPLW
jgi:hypothetical protein